MIGNHSISAGNEQITTAKLLTLLIPNAVRRRDLLTTPWNDMLNLRLPGRKGEVEQIADVDGTVG
jgi:hypothetical protein